jgi:cytochrome c553
MCLGAAAMLGMVAVFAPARVQGVAIPQQEFLDASRSKPDLDRGAKLFQPCAGCHGADGGGTVDGLIPRIAGQHASVLMKQLVDYRHDRRWDLRMEHFTDRHHLPDAQAIADVAAYVSQLDSKAANGQGNGELVARGAGSYARLCQRCHGEAAQGDARHSIPRLAGQHYEYLRRQIYDAVDRRRPNFSPAHIRLLARLDRDGIEAIADYLSRARSSEVRDGARLRRN